MGRRCRAGAAGSARPEWGAGAEQRLPGARGRAEVAARPVRPYAGRRQPAGSGARLSVGVTLLPQPAAALQRHWCKLLVLETTVTNLSQQRTHSISCACRAAGGRKKGLESGGGGGPVFTFHLNVACVKLPQTRVALSSESQSVLHSSVAVFKVAVQVLPSVQSDAHPAP